MLVLKLNIFSRFEGRYSALHYCKIVFLVEVSWRRLNQGVIWLGIVCRKLEKNMNQNGMFLFGWNCFMKIPYNLEFYLEIVLLKILLLFHKALLNIHIYS
jgi:hypothetical protein